MDCCDYKRCVSDDDCSTYNMVTDDYHDDYHDDYDDPDDQDDHDDHDKMIKSSPVLHSQRVWDKQF